MANKTEIRVNDQELRLTLRNFRQMVSPAPLLRIAAEIMRESRERTFREQGSPAGSWPPLAVSTIRQRGGRPFRYGEKGTRTLQGLLRGGMKNAIAGRMILIRSGRLKNSITSAIVGGNRLLIGTNLVYAAIQQFGGNAGRGHAAHIPARPYLVFRPEDPERMTSAMQAHIDQVIKSLGAGPA